VKSETRNQGETSGRDGIPVIKIPDGAEYVSRTTAIAAIHITDKGGVVKRRATLFKTRKGGYMLS